MTSSSDHRRFNALERPDRYDDRLDTERHSEAASRAASRRVVAPMTPEQRLAADLRNQEYLLEWQLDRLIGYGRPDPPHPVVIERDGRWLTLYDRNRICWSSTPNGGTRLSIDEARDFQAKCPLYLAGTTIVSLEPKEVYAQWITHYLRSSGSTASSDSPSMATAL
jgi:hypothetical protein